MLASLVHSLGNRPDMQNAIARLMHPDDMLETFNDLAETHPDLTRLVLQASVASLVNAQSMMAEDDEIQRRAVKGNRGMRLSASRTRTPGGVEGPRSNPGPYPDLVMPCLPRGQVPLQTSRNHVRSERHRIRPLE